MTCLIGLAHLGGVVSDWNRFGSARGEIVAKLNRLVKISLNFLFSERYILIFLEACQGL